MKAALLTFNLKLWNVTFVRFWEEQGDKEQPDSPHRSLSPEHVGRLTWWSSRGWASPLLDGLMRSASPSPPWEQNNKCDFKGHALKMDHAESCTRSPLACCLLHGRNSLKEHMFNSQQPIPAHWPRLVCCSDDRCHQQSHDCQNAYHLFNDII